MFYCFGGGGELRQCRLTIFMFLSSPGSRGSDLLDCNQLCNYVINVLLHIDLIVQLQGVNLMNLFLKYYLAFD